MATLSEFINSYFLWRDPVIVGASAGAVCGFLGVYVVLRRIVFVSAALTQISSFGVGLAFYLQALGLGVLAYILDPFVLSIFLTCLAALFFALKRDYSRVSTEGVIAFGYLLASGAVLIIGDRIAKGAHDIANILFGSAVVVAPADVLIIPLVALAVFVIHTLLYKDFIFVSFDSETARLFKYPVRLLNTALLISIAVIVALTTRALGALPVFALLALPALSALYITENLKLVFLFSILFGIISSVLGYFFSFIFSLPTGASITVCAAGFFIISLIWRKITAG